MAASLALVIALGAAVIRVSGLEARELEAVGEWTPAGSSRLLEARLLRGDDATFELCARDPMEATRWSGAGRIVVVRTDRAEEMFGLAIDPALLEGVARSEAGSCVVFARVRELAIDEDAVPVAIELASDDGAIEGVPVRARILAREPLGERDLAIVLGALGVAIGLVLVMTARAPVEAHDVASRGAVRAALGVALVLGAGITIGAFGPSGPTAGLVGGLALAAVEIAVAYVLVRPSVEGAQTAALGLVRAPRAPSWVGEPTRARRLALPYTIGWLVLAPLVGVLLSLVARVALAIVPSTGEAPVEAFVSWPSGMLSFAALAVVAPIAEEVFFRGLVYGALRGPGGAKRELVAIAGAWLLFAIAHAPQDWGNWGGLVSVLIAGLGFTLMRAASGSTLVPCVAHLVYNGLLAAGALAAGAT
ncbi:CPBP family intramembrane glutamic endopeptidase [Sandaracinus amylolyticus]|uniref:CPBP family intramembrane glutamic endopeptidase n=1 Tax=Sandaracinus amylolyticus TaxID=927083 RepID=UPI001F17B61B|nr:CPBP family intramembrane glutamic endopeptidase [Sandaracinus amylolyticus]